MDFEFVVDVFVATFPVRARDLLNYQKPLFLQWISMFLLFREPWFWMIFLMFFRIIVGIDFWSLWASILAPFWDPLCIKIHVFFYIFVYGFLNRCLIDLWSKMDPKVRSRSAAHLYFLISFFYTRVPFTHVRPTSARNHFSNFLEKIEKIYPHLYILHS